MWFVVIIGEKYAQISGWYDVPYMYMHSNNILNMCSCVNHHHHAVCEIRREGIFMYLCVCVRVYTENTSILKHLFIVEHKTRTFM